MIWDGICGELDKATEQGRSLEKASVNNDVEEVCRKIAQALYRTYLECMESSEVKDVAEKHKCMGRAKNKDNIIGARYCSGLELRWHEGRRRIVRFKHQLRAILNVAHQAPNQVTPREGSM